MQRPKITWSYLFLCVSLGVGGVVLGCVITTITFKTAILPQYNASCGLAQSSNARDVLPFKGTEPVSPFKPSENNTDTPVTPRVAPTGKKRIIMQERKLRALPPCKPMLVPVWLKEEVLSGLDDFLDMALVTTVVAVERCPETVGLCYGKTRCRPKNSVNITVDVRYIRYDTKTDVLQREVRKDLECACQL